MTDRRAVGGPVPLRLLAAYTGLALLAWLAAAAALVAAAPDLAGGAVYLPAPLLVVHLVALGLLSFGVAGASFHLLPVMLRNDLRSTRLLWFAALLLAGGFAVAPGVAWQLDTATWAGTAALGAGIAIVLVELAGLVVRAPGDRTLVVSRTGVALSLLHALAALALGAVVYDHGYATFAGVGHERWLLVHLHLALIGWLTLLIVAVGRTLGPMLALAPAAPARKLPVAETALVFGLWVLAAGLASGAREARLAGGALAAAAIGGFVAVLGRSALRRRGTLEAPLLHLAAGVVFLAQAAVVGLGAAAGAFDGARPVVAYVCFLLLGWAAGVVVGHLGKLLSLSVWVWWPPGPRPKQTELYPRRLWLVEAVLLAAGVELLGAGVLADSGAAARAGAALLAASALAAAAGAAVTWERRARSS